MRVSADRRHRSIPGIVIVWGLLCGVVAADDGPTSLFAPAEMASSSAPTATTRPVTPPAAKATAASLAPIMSEATSGVSLDLQAQKDAKFRELKRQLEILNQLAPQFPGSPEMPVPVPVDTVLVPPVDQSEPRHDSLPYALSKPEPPPSKMHLHPGTSQSPMGEDAHGQSSPAADAPMIVDGTIDRFSLATSLFGTGQVETCLDVLKYADLKQLPREDQIWADYMIACCQRRMGQLDLAKQSYRRILAEKDTEEIGKLARWWLDDLEAKAQLKMDIQRLSETLAAWEAEIESLSKSTAGATAAQ